MGGDSKVTMKRRHARLVVALMSAAVVVFATAVSAIASSPATLTGEVPAAARSITISDHGPLDYGPANAGIPDRPLYGDQIIVWSSSQDSRPGVAGGMSADTLREAELASHSLLRGPSPSTLLDPGASLLMP
jgi:hypothetical protein